MHELWRIDSRGGGGGGGGWRRKRRSRRGRVLKRLIDARSPGGRRELLSRRIVLVLLGVQERSGRTHWRLKAKGWSGGLHLRVSGRHEWVRDTGQSCRGLVTPGRDSSGGSTL